MRCLDCGKEHDGPGERCRECDSEQQVTVLTPGERERFQGVTIQQDDETGEEHYRETGRREAPRVHVRYIQMQGGSFWSRLLLILAVIAFLAALLFVALPIMLVVIAVVVVASFLVRLLR